MKGWRDDVLVVAFVVGAFLAGMLVGSLRSCQEDAREWERLQEAEVQWT